MNISEDNLTQILPPSRQILVYLVGFVVSAIQRSVYSDEQFPGKKVIAYSVS